MSKLLLIDGNSILNRAFYGIMTSNMLKTKDGRYTNAVYGFLAIMFKELEEVKPDHMMVAFDLKAPTKRHEMYKEYKANRHGMPQELAEQMPMIKEVLKAMNIAIVTKEGYEGDDILGTLSVLGEKNGFDVVILSGDRDNFQLASDKVTIRIPRTKAGKTETEEFNKKKVKEVYGLLPKQLKDVKALQGDTSDNIPGVPGIGEKSALSLIQTYESIEKLYKGIDEGTAELKPKQKENLINNKELAFLSKELGTIDINAPLDVELDDLKIVPWDYEKVLEIFRDLNFKKYIEKFNLENMDAIQEMVAETKKEIKSLYEKKIIDENDFKEVYEKIKKQSEIYYYFEKSENNFPEYIIKKEIRYINIYIEEDNVVYSIDFSKVKDSIKEIFENKDIKKIGNKLKEDYIILKQIDINPENMYFDIEIAAYLLDAVSNKYDLDTVVNKYLDIDLTELDSQDKEEGQTSLFDESPKENKPNEKYIAYSYAINKLKKVLEEKLTEIESVDLFYNIEMPIVTILADMQWQGMRIDNEDLVDYGESLKKSIEELKLEIYEIAGEEFNINSPKQLGVILFEKLQLPLSKKNKNGYSTAEEELEKLKPFSPIIEKILDYRQLSKLNSTYVEGMFPFINPKTGRVHTFFHQTVTATGRLSSSEPNLQNIPTRSELGKMLRKVFKPSEDCVYVDADYSQVELRVLAHMSNDETMIEAFNSGKDIHTISASQVFKVPVEEVSKQLRSKAKAVNFGIVYGISEFGLAEQIGVSRYEAKEYIEKYLETYHGIKTFMDEIVEEAKKNGYVTTLFGRRRYIEELNSSKYMIRQFGQRAAMNTPIQGTAADIMKIAMIKVYNELKARKLKSKMVLQVHDELIIEAYIDEKEEIKQLLKECMENAVSMKVPLTVEAEEGTNWYEAK